MVLLSKVVVVVVVAISVVDVAAAADVLRTSMEWEMIYLTS